MSVRAAPDSVNLRKALHTWSTSNNADVDNLSVEQKQQAIAHVSKSLDMRPVDVLRQIEVLFPNAFGPDNGAKAMATLGASHTYRATSGATPQAGRLVGTRMTAMMGAGFMPTQAQLDGFLHAQTPADVRDRASRHLDMSKGYALLTAEQFFDDVRVPPRAQTVARKALQKVAERTASHFSPDGLIALDDADLNQRSLLQHTGYVAGNLSRQFGIDEGQARDAVVEYYTTGGDIDRLIADLGPDGPKADFFKKNGWMVGGSYGDDGKWGFWGFGELDKALNRPGIYAGEATLEFAEAMSPGNGEALMTSMLAKSPEDWNETEAAVGQFGLRAAQAGWLTAKTGRGIVEAHNPKKEARSLKCWAPANDLVCDFNTLKERKDWGEIAKDLDQIRNAARSMGIDVDASSPEKLTFGVVETIDGSGRSADHVSLRTHTVDGKAIIELEDKSTTFTDGHISTWSLMIDGEAVDGRHHLGSRISYGPNERERTSSHKWSKTLASDSRVSVEVRNSHTGESRSFAFQVPADVGLSNDDVDTVLGGGAASKAVVDRMTHILTAEASRALEQPGFSTRNRLMAEAVGSEAGLLAAKSLGLSSEQAEELQSDFTFAARRAGRHFEPAFADDGKPIKAQESAYKKAMSAAGGEALDTLDGLAESFGLHFVDARSVVENARLEDVAALVASDYGFDAAAEGMTGQALADAIADVVPENDYFRKHVDSLPLRSDDDTPLTGDQQKALGVGIRLANATWKAGQVHRAAWEGNDDRINPQKRNAFNTYDSMARALYDDTLAQLRQDGDASPENGAFARVVFEVYKALCELKDAAGDV